MQAGSVVLVVVLSFVAAGSLSTRYMHPQELPAGYVEISGAKSPMSIPDWLAWRNALGALARSARDPNSVIFAILKTDDQERKLIGDFANGQEALWEECRARQLAIVQRLKDADPKHAQALINQDEIACRTALLDAKDAFLPSLTSRAAMALRSFVDDNRSNISVYVHATGLEHFRRPR